MNKHSILIHGGAGTILQSTMTAEKERQYKNALQESLTAGNLILEQGGSALNAVEAAVVILENCPLFNAGRGSVFTHEGVNEMDASIMDGKTLMAGAVAGIRNIKNPVVLARAVMEKSEHVFMCGKGAEEFARTINLPFEKNEYFFTQQRYDQLMAIRDSDQTQLDHTISKDPLLKGTMGNEKPGEKKFGTVGAVALDLFGNIAAATSTGGMTNKKYGRIGDSPVIGAGTYANNLTCAVSCTGHGEYFIRAVVAYDISCLMEYKGLSLKDACDLVVHKKLMKIGGEGGLIAIDTQGNAALVFNSEGMYRGMKKQGEDFVIEIYK